MNIVIVAGGLGTRFNGLSVFPKILLPTNKYNSILEEDLNVFKDNKVYLIINSKFASTVKNYIDVNNLKGKVKVFSTTNFNGSYNSIKNAYNTYKGYLPTDNVLFIWSDIVLNSIPDFDISKNIIFTYQGQKYRYGVKDNEIKLSYDYSGNIPGIYYLKNVKDVLVKFYENEFNNFDLIDAIKDSGIDFDTYELDYLFEYKDYDTYIKKLKEYSDNSLKTRFFNKLEINNDKLKKSAIVESYYPIIEKEYNWYNFGNKYIDNFKKITPEVFGYDNHSFEMEYLQDYIPLHKVLKNQNLTIKDVEKIYKNINNAIKELETYHVPYSKKVFESDLKKEVIDKVIDRCDKIKYMLITYDKDYMISLLNSAYDYLLKLEKNNEVEYYFGHGDLNGSNILVNPNNFDIKFIDPRGYFGYTSTYIWKDYEYAKLLYCLYGYDDFNNLPQIYGIDKPKKLKWVSNIKYLNKKKYKILVGIIYIALAGYISQDIMKCNIAYEYGIEILNDELNVHKSK